MKKETLAVMKHFNKHSLKYYNEGKTNKFLKLHKNQLLTKNILSFNPRNVLEIGAAYGRNFKPLQDRGVVVKGYDIANEMVKFKNKNDNIVLFGGNIIPEANRTYDVVFTSLCLLHVKKPEILISEMKRVCKKSVVLWESDIRDIPFYIKKFKKHWVFWHNFKKYNFERVQGSKFLFEWLKVK